MAKQDGPGNKSGRHATKLLVEERCDIIDQMMRQGYTDSTIQVMLSKEWKVTRRQVRNYTRKVYLRWKKEKESAQPQRIIQRRAQLEGVLELALRQVPPNLKAAVAALDRLCRIDSCYPADRLDVDFTAQVGVGMGLSAMGFTSAEDVRARLDELQARLLNGGPIAAGYLEGTGHEEAPTGSGRPGNGHARGGNGSAESN